MNNYFEHFDKVQRRAVYLIIPMVLLQLSLVGFGVWVIVKLLQHFSVI